MYDEPIPGRKNAYRTKLNDKLFIVKRIAASVVEPNLYNSELQDSYGVKKPEDLVYAMIDDPEEFYALSAFVANLNGHEDINDKIAEVKN